MTALVTASDPGAFLDGETWAFALTINQPDSEAPFDLTGSRLYVAFGTILGGDRIAVCDSGAGDNSIVLTDPTHGVATFTITPVARNGWAVPRLYYRPNSAVTVVGDLYRFVSGGAGWEGLVRISFPVLASFGTPS